MSRSVSVERNAQPLLKGKLSRRELVTKLGLLGLSPAVGGLLAASQYAPAAATGAPAATSAGAATASQDTQDSADWRAIALAKEAAQGQDITLTIMHPSGAKANFDPLASQWTEATGIKIELAEAELTKVFQRAMQEAITKTSTFDIYIVDSLSVPDLAEANLIADLTENIQTYNPELSSGDSPILPPMDVKGKYKGRDYAIPSDGDVYQLFLRTDLLQDPENQADFKAKYGMDLKPPETFDEYNKQMEFFTRADGSLYGGANFRSVGYAHSTFLPLLAAHGRFLFDDDMHPQLTTPEGIAAAQEMVDTTKFQLPDMSTFGWAEQYSAFGSGRAYSAFSWPSFQKFNSNPNNSKVVGQFEPFAAPKATVNDKSFRVTMYSVGWTWTVSNYSRAPLAAYAFAQWMTSPKISEVVVTKEGVFDPFRQGHFNSPDIVKAYDQAFIEVGPVNAAASIPDIILRGGNEYVDVLTRNLNAACYTGKPVEDALKEVEAAWEQTTERLGRDNQKTAWQGLKQAYPADVQAAMIG
jgi:multiple sugar transport system substrate-binding protein